MSEKSEKRGLGQKRKKKPYDRKVKKRKVAQELLGQLKAATKRLMSAGSPPSSAATALYETGLFKLSPLEWQCLLNELIEPTHEARKREQENADHTCLCPNPKACECIFDIRKVGIKDKEYHIKVIENAVALVCRGNGLKLVSFKKVHTKSDEKSKPWFDEDKAYLVDHILRQSFLLRAPPGHNSEVVEHLPADDSDAARRDCRWRHWTAVSKGKFEFEGNRLDFKAHNQMDEKGRVVHGTESYCKQLVRVYEISVETINE